MNIAVTLDQCFDQCFLSIKPIGGWIRTLNLRINNQVLYRRATSSSHVGDNATKLVFFVVEGNKLCRYGPFFGLP
jgi:hypothetical protein